MSADNGIYILRTNGPVWRVACLQAIDNLSWDEDRGGYSDDPEVEIRNARMMFAGAPVFTTEYEASACAEQLERGYYESGDILEYGTCQIHIDRWFDRDGDEKLIADKLTIGGVVVPTETDYVPEFSATLFDTRVRLIVTSGGAECYVRMGYGGVIILTHDEAALLHRLLGHYINEE